MDRPALAAFLVQHRADLRPEDVGLPAGARRRTAGLRREEVALLAAMSVDYYTRLEQRRGPQPSPPLLAALARALRLTDDERDYLFRVAGHPAPDRSSPQGHVAPGLLRVLDRLTDTPALIITSLGETLVQNEPARALFGDTDHLRGPERSAIHRWFADPASGRSAYPARDHAHQGRLQVAQLRAAYGREATRARAAEMARDLTARSPEFAQLWERQEVGHRFEDRKTVVHPQIGEIDVDCQALFTEDESQVLLVLTAPPRSEAASRLALLAVIGSEDPLTAEPGVRRDTGS
ncbi:helix-turn-helix transcriptional regulator [Brachybacterium sp. NBEC-018]|uniref:helix-turn-helix transcriptional regulator n=1 Tax=Brachybacterium sp. NBEC-018 TaxID=2996004 RepID=UPI002174DFD9|nr:helix-turn-helix transcriptional regulator [Brachybacterium sp. NBEC-018]UVY82655.1 helix-turn-helix transcriptional regulator [Brachybacterium sp. NBEC-018]